VNKIEEAITKDGKLLDKLQTPCSVFATFETEEGCQRALYYNKTVQMDFLGEELIIDEASEPTDIIWENRQYEPRDRFFKSLIVWVLVFFMLGVSAAVIYKCTLISNGAKFMFPVANCTAAAGSWAQIQ